LVEIRRNDPRNKDSSREEIRTEISCRKDVVESGRELSSVIALEHKDDRISVEVNILGVPVIGL